MRAHVSHLWPIAVSPHRLADMLCLRLEVVSVAIQSGALECRRIGTKRRVLIRDAEAWLRSKPKVGVRNALR